MSLDRQLPGYGGSTLTHTDIRSSPAALWRTGSGRGIICSNASAGLSRTPTATPRPGSCGWCESRLLRARTCGRVIVLFILESRVHLEALPSRPRPSVAGVEMRPCFLCGSQGFCSHREPELLSMAERTQNRIPTVYSEGPGLFSNDPELRDYIIKRARELVHRALKTGELVKPEKCEVCNKSRKLHVYHDDYSKALDVAWLCALCRGRLIGERKSGVNNNFPFGSEVEICHRPFLVRSHSEAFQLKFPQKKTGSE